MSDELQSQTLALAGVFQAAHLVQQIANTGRANEPAMAASLESLFQLDPTDVESVFGGAIGVVDGLRTLVRQLGDDGSDRDADVMRYVLSLMRLEGKMRGDARRVEQIRLGIEAAREQLEFFAVTHGNAMARLADLYQQTLSTIQPRIMVSGDQNHLRNPDNATRIRAVLLAGLRATVLWRQTGGSRLRLLFRRRRYAECAQRLLAEL